MARSLRFARRIAGFMIGAITLENPAGSPRLRSVIRVEPLRSEVHAYVVSIGNGPCCVRITRRSPGTRSTNSYVYRNVRPRNLATNSTCVPTRSGGGVFHSTESMLAYQSGAFDGSAAKDETMSVGRAMTISVSMSTLMR